LEDDAVWLEDDAVWLEDDAAFEAVAAAGVEDAAAFEAVAAAGVEDAAAGVEDAAAGVEDAEFDSPIDFFLSYVLGTPFIRAFLSLFGTTTVSELLLEPEPELELELLVEEGGAATRVFFDSIGPLSFFCGFNPQKKLRLSPI